MRLSRERFRGNVHEAGARGAAFRVPCVSVAAIISVIVSGCGAVSDAPDVVLRDSAGITIVDNRPVDVREAGRVAQSFSLEIGGDEAVQLYQVVGAVLLPDGRMVVGNAGTSEALWFDTSGSLIARAGRSGEGPGEFQALSAIASRGDTVFAWDRALRRVTVFRDGALVRDVPVDIPPDRPLPQMRGVLATGEIVAIPGPVYIPENNPGVQRPPMPVWLLSSEGAAVHTFGPFPGPEVNLHPATSQGWIRTVVPFGASTIVAAGGSTIVVIDNSTFDVRTYGSNGELEKIIRLNVPHRDVSAEAIEAELERRLASAPPVEEIREGIRASFERTAPARKAPSYTSALVDDRGAIWAKRATLLDTEPQTWDVFDADGAWNGHVTVPARLRITSVAGGNVLGVALDELGVERVRRYTLMPADGT